MERLDQPNAYYSVPVYSEDAPATPVLSPTVPTHATDHDSVIYPVAPSSRLAERFDQDALLPARYRTIRAHRVVLGQVMPATIAKRKPSTTTVRPKRSLEPTVSVIPTPSKRPEQRSTRAKKPREVAWPIYTQLGQQHVPTWPNEWYIGFDISPLSPGIACRHPRTKTLHLVYIPQNKTQPHTPAHHTIRYDVPLTVGSRYIEWLQPLPVRGTTNSDRPGDTKLLSDDTVDILRSCDTASIDELQSRWFTWNWSIPSSHSSFGRTFDTIYLHRVSAPVESFNQADRHRQRVQRLLDRVFSIIGGDHLPGFCRTPSVMPDTIECPGPYRPGPVPWTIPPPSPTQSGRFPAFEPVADSPHPPHVLLEDYTYHNSENSARQHLIYEVTALFKSGLAQRGIGFERLSNSVPKMVWAGNGSANKHLMWRACEAQCPEVVWALEQHFQFDYREFWVRRIQAAHQRRRRDKPTERATSSMTPVALFDNKTLPDLPAPLSDLIDAMVLSFLPHHPSCFTDL